MLFNSMDYLCFFPIVVIAYFFLPKKIRNIWLLAASYYFYMSWNAKYGFLILLVTINTYFLGLAIEKLKKRGGTAEKYLTIAIILNIGILFLFKYTDFFINNLNRILQRINGHVIDKPFDWVLPIGISFYIFQAVGYVIDVYREKVPAEKNFFQYALFISFFPQLVAGPIERTENMMHQLKDGTDFDVEKARRGLLLILWGIFLKVVLADNIAVIVTNVYSDFNSYTGMQIALATMLFAIQIYCDFGGYSYIAIGSAQVLGYKLMNNFDCPYFAGSVTEFWKRWHISLTSWFTDYVYIPLGGNRKGTARKYINTLVVFGLSGLWHGASWNFIAWGLINGLFIIYEKLTVKQKEYNTNFFEINKLSYAYRGMQRVKTFLLICFTWLFFRADSFRTALSMLKKIFQLPNFRMSFADLNSLGVSAKTIKVILCGTLLLFLLDWLNYKKIDIKQFILNQNFLCRYFIYMAFIMILIIYGNYGGNHAQTEFIYFQF